MCRRKEKGAGAPFLFMGLVRFVVYSHGVCELEVKFIHTRFVIRACDNIYTGLCGCLFAQGYISLVAMMIRQAIVDARGIRTLPNQAI